MGKTPYARAVTILKPLEGTRYETMAKRSVISSPDPEKTARMIIANYRVLVEFNQSLEDDAA